MVREAESHAADDKKFEELITARNQADSLIHATKKTLNEAKDKVQSDEKSKIETAISELEVALKGDDLASIKAKTETLSQASGNLAQRMYAEAAAAQQKTGDAGASTASSASGKPGGDAVDAEFEEVKDDK
jgi:molecular chaperone DnaK